VLRPGDAVGGGRELLRVLVLRLAERWLRQPGDHLRLYAAECDVFRGLLRSGWNQGQRGVCAVRDLPASEADLRDWERSGMQDLCHAAGPSGERPV